MSDLAAALKEELVGPDHEHVTTTGISNEKLAMWTFLGSECLLFGGLISTFLLYKTRAADGETPHELYDILFTSISSFVLLMSSLTMVLAVSAIQRRDLRAMQGWLLTTALLGVVFISGQVYEFTEFVNEGYGMTHSPAWSAFFTLTGFHGVHVTLGIVMLISTAALAWRGHITHKNAEAVEIVGLYWHFVDVVWVIIFTVVYLIK
ncbi:heme-copper oxidase subunit III [Aquihabitans daechungensis]|uniref:cytochrome c oxidase subunit 3 n=1 Tax=Aquihabitans daechungensis TaxID=1052257 RepID=UPI003BA2BF7D